MPTSFTVRLDELAADGGSRDGITRHALELAHRTQADDRMRRESAELLEDPRDFAEARERRSKPTMRGDRQMRER